MIRRLYHLAQRIRKSKERKDGTTTEREGDCGEEEN